MQTQSQQLVRVIAAIVDERQLTLYQESGETIVIPQGDERLARIVKHITPILASGPGSVAEVDIGEGEQLNPYREYEAQAKGQISFFKVAKTRLASWLHRAADAIIAPPIEPVSPMTLGNLPGSMPKALTPADSIFVENNKQTEPVDTSPLVSKTEAERLLAATDEIIKHAQPVSAPGFHDQDVGEQGSATIIAVVKSEDGPKVVGGVEALKPQFTRAVQSASTKGMDAFMQRVAAVADKRRHSVDDLMKFLKRGDLPIADDGTIVIYKVLRRKEAGSSTYVDCHTRKVPQRVGSYVCMDEKLVDPNRHNECSNGLHVARRAYVGGFSGDVVVLAKVRPEDVIAVPQYDANKMRVCGYHILFELSDDAFSKLKSNRPFTDNEEAQILLGRALAGDHPEPIEEVRITEQMGGGVQIKQPIRTKVVVPAIEDSVEKPPTEEKVEVKAAEALPDAVEGKLNAPVLDPKAVVKEVTKAKVEAESRSQKASRLFNDFNKAKSDKAKREAAQILLDYKKSVKLGWSALGLSDETGGVMKDTFLKK